MFTEFYSKCSCYFNLYLTTVTKYQEKLSIHTEGFNNSSLFNNACKFNVYNRIKNNIIVFCIRYTYLHKINANRKNLRKKHSEFPVLASLMKNTFRQKDVIFSLKKRF